MFAKSSLIRKRALYVCQRAHRHWHLPKSAVPILFDQTIVAKVSLRIYGPFRRRTGLFCGYAGFLRKCTALLGVCGLFCGHKTFLFEQTIVAKVFGLSITGRVVQKLCCVCGSCVRRMCV